MMRNVIMILQVIAVFCAYLVMSIPVISASQISVYMPGGETLVFSIDPAEKVSRSVEIVHEPSDHQWANVQVKIEIVGNDPAYAVKKVYLFKCKNSSPSVCSSYIPVEAKNYLSGEKGTFYWNDVSANSIAGFMSLVQMEHAGKIIWVGFWDEIERASLQSFDHSSYEVDSVELYAKSDEGGEWIKSFMQDYYMVPMTLVDRGMLGVVDGKMPSKMYELSANQAELEVSPFLMTKTDEGNTVSSVIKDYTFVFGKGSIASPVTFYGESPFRCGDGTCETDIGENAGTCCIDCGCTGNDECTATKDYPNGVCHECGNYIIEPTENSTTCCADAGCPAGKSCNMGRNLPYGACMLPDCGNGLCDVPEEDAGSCCIDCGSTQACASQFGAGYYCNEDLVSCVMPGCGNGQCEPGEDYSNCCLDCDSCPAGEYCNANESENGVCMPTTCGNGQCEPGEDYSNCCLDCDSCPIDPTTGKQQTCSANTCHLCGNGVLEEPAESESTCCDDSGCSEEGDFCSLEGSCISTDVMRMAVMVVPENVDCTLEDPISLKITLLNKPKYFDYFRSAYYNYAGSQRMMMCQENGDFYECVIPVTGPDSFPGCFDAGPHAINLTLNFYYFRDKTAEEDWDSSYATLAGSALVNVQKARSRVCDRDGSCELGIGETSESCCWDCGCDGGLICTASGCAGGSSITLAVDDGSLPAREQVDCGPGLGALTYSATVQNVPYSSDDPFGVVDWMLFYEGRNFTAATLPGFKCEPESGSGAMLTGRVECSIPISLFPPCPYEPPASLSMSLYVVGGGLSDSYGAYTGKRLDDSFQIDYIKGLPNCGNGVPDDGETSDNCCRDVGCPDGRLCSLYSGCIEEGELGLTVSVSPGSINCSGSGGDLVFTAEVDPKPIGFPKFEDTYLDRVRIDHYCSAGLESDYVLECSIPLVDLTYCYELGYKTVTFETSMYYEDVNDTSRVDFSKDVEFFVNTVRERECDMDGVCEYKIGEIPDQCCSDCGCSGGDVCTFENECKDPSAMSLRLEHAIEVDCSGENGYFFAIDAEILNQPYGTTDVDWYIRLGSDTYGSEIFSCSLTEGENKYKCDISVYNLPLCHTHDTKTMTLAANVSYTDAIGYEHNAIAESDVTIEPSSWLDSCSNPITGGNPACQPEIGETQTNCCQDCGCGSFGSDYVCTADGCQPKHVVSLSISPRSIVADCTLIADEFYIDEDEGEGQITKYLCVFRKPAEIEALVENMPAHSSNPIEMFYYLDGDKDDKIQDGIAWDSKTSHGWELEVQQRAFESSSRNIDSSHRLGLGFTLVVYDGDNEIVIPLESKNDISLTYNAKDSDSLISIENRLKELEDDIKKMQDYLNMIGFLIGFCACCLGGAVGLGEFISTTTLFKTLISLTIIMAWYVAVGFGATYLGSEWQWYAMGAATGDVLVFATEGTCCNWMEWICTYGLLIAVMLAFYLTNKMSEAQEDADADIQNDIALGKVEVGDDLSFYYS